MSRHRSLRNGAGSTRGNHQLLYPSSLSGNGTVRNHLHKHTHISIFQKPICKFLWKNSSLCSGSRKKAEFLPGCSLHKPQDHCFHPAVWHTFNQSPAYSLPDAVWLGEIVEAGYQNAQNFLWSGRENRSVHQMDRTGAMVLKLSLQISRSLQDEEIQRTVCSSKLFLWQDLTCAA